MPKSHGEAIKSAEFSKASANSKINNIQVLRAFAALAVVFFHTNYQPTGHAIGSFGVDVFFVISGYIMARICDRNPQFFLRRRLIRIVPPYWLLTILLYFGAKFFPALMGFTRPIPVFLIKSLLFIPFFKSPNNIQPLLFLGWTLNFEMFFYLSVAAGIFLFRRRPIFLASILVVATTLACRTWGHGGAITLFFSNWIVLEFLVGAATYYLIRLIPEVAARRLRWPLLIGVIGAAAFLTGFQALGLVFTSAPWLPYCTASFVMVFCAVLLSKSGWDTEFQWIVLAGDSSYILYLLHPYCIFIFGRIISRHLPFFDITHLVGSLVACLTILLISIAVHLKMEVPTVDFLNRHFGGHRRSTEFKVAT